MARTLWPVTSKVEASYRIRSINKLDTGRILVNAGSRMHQLQLGTPPSKKSPGT